MRNAMLPRPKRVLLVAEDDQFASCMLLGPAMSFSSIAT
jgi:hypothetical protein